MKTLHSFVLKPGLFSSGIIALIIMCCVCEPAFAARLAGTDENVNTTTETVDTTKKIIEAAPSETADGAKQDVTSAKPEKEVKAEGAIKESGTIKEEKSSARAVKKEDSKKYVTIDFDNVDIGVLVKFVSELTGKNFIIDDKVKGKVTVISPKKIPVSDVYKVFLSVLEVNGYTVVPAGDMIKIVPASLAREKSVETRIKNEPGAPDDRMVTQIISLERANPDEIKRVLDPIISKSSSLISYPPAGILVITDYLSNIKRLQEIILALDVEGAGDQISYIPLKNASASEVVKSLTAIFQQRQAKTTAIKFVADTRTNSIIILASIADTENVRKLVAMIDKDVPRSDSNIQVYYLQNSLAEDLAKVLNSIKDSSAAATANTAASAAGTQKAVAPVISKNVQVVPDKATNTLVIMAEREDYKVLENIIKQLDVPRAMVYIEALIMEVNVNTDFQLGVEWRGLKSVNDSTAAFVGSGGAGTSTNPGAYSILDSIVTPATSSTSTTTTTFPNGFSLGVLGTGITIAGITFPTIGAVIQAYKTDQDVSILATPQILTLDNEDAEINVGENVPYITQQQASNVTNSSVSYNTYEYKDVGVILDITPHINQENFIRLKISLQNTKLTSAATSPTPTTLKRTVKTTTVVKDNETIVIGGLVGDSTEDDIYRVPLLGDIPYLGWLFRTHSNTREKTNMYVFLTPHIVRTKQDADKIYREKRGGMGEVVEGVIKLNEKTLEQKQQSESKPAENKVPDKP
ncbi:MAG: type II secretion system secretin GspD [Smithella sp.]